MLKLHLSGRPTEDNINLFDIADHLEGFSANDFRFFVDEAARLAMKNQVPITGNIFHGKSHNPSSITNDVEKL